MTGVATINAAAVKVASGAVHPASAQRAQQHSEWELPRAHPPALRRRLVTRLGPFHSLSSFLTPRWIWITWLFISPIWITWLFISPADYVLLYLLLAGWMQQNTIYSIHPGERGLRRNGCPRDDTWLFGTHHYRWREQLDAGRRFVGLTGPASTASAPWWTPPCRRKPRGFLALASSVFSKKTTRGERRATRALFLQRPRAATAAPPCPPCQLGPADSP